MSKVAALRARGKLAEAIPLCTRAIELDGANAAAWLARAACHMQLAAGVQDLTEAARLIALGREDYRRWNELKLEN